MPSPSKGYSEKLSKASSYTMTDYPNNRTDISPEYNLKGNLSELEIILREDFGLELEKDDVRNIGMSLTGYVDTLLEISNG